MQKSLITLMIIAALSLSLVGFSTDSAAQRGDYGKHHGRDGWGAGYGVQGDWNYCPYCGRSFHGRGGHGMGPGMMMGPGRPHDWDYRDPQEPLDEKGARRLVEEFLDSSRNPNLKIGGIEDEGANFVAEIITKDGSLVDKLVVDKDSGFIRSIY